MDRLQDYLYGRRFGIAWMLCAVFAIGLLYSVYLWFSYSRPMVQERFGDAAQSMAADTPTALYDAALQHYKARHYAVAAKILTNAYNACQSGAGGIAAGRKQLAAGIKFLAGNALVNDGKLKTAIDAYKDCLRLDPGNMQAKNNLESLLQMNGGKGPPEDGGSSASPGHGPRHGI